MRKEADEWVEPSRRWPLKWMSCKTSCGLKEASGVHLMAASRDRSREDSQAQSQIYPLIGMV
jgi:hypothetical protein